MVLIFVHCFVNLAQENIVPPKQLMRLNLNSIPIMQSKTESRAGTSLPADRVVIRTVRKYPTCKPEEQFEPISRVI